MMRRAEHTGNGDRNPNAAFGRNQMVLWRDALRSRPPAMGRRPRRSVALQIDWKYGRGQL